MTLSVLPGGEEGRLGFTALALHAFEFLQHRKFAVTLADPTLVRFESPSIIVNVYHGRSSFQLGVELERPEHGERFSGHELLTAMAPDQADRARCQAVTRDVLERCIEALAEVVRARCQLLLDNDEDAFKRLRSIVDPARQSATLQAQFGAMIDRADKAWEEKRFQVAAELYSKAQPALDVTRRRRLDYLMRHGKAP